MKRDFEFLKDYALWRGWERDINSFELIARVYFVLWIVALNKKPFTMVFTQPVYAKPNTSKKNLTILKKQTFDKAWKTLSKHIKKGRIPKVDEFKPEQKKKGFYTFATLAPITAIPKAFQKQLKWYHK